MEVKQQRSQDNFYTCPSISFLSDQNRLCDLIFVMLISCRDRCVWGRIQTLLQLWLILSPRYLLRSLDIALIYQGMIWCRNTTLVLYAYYDQISYFNQTLIQHLYKYQINIQNMQVLQFLKGKKKQQVQATQFTPSIQISPNSTLFVQVTPNDPHTGSNIVINSYPSKTNRTNLQTRIQWRRFKILAESEHTSTHLPFITGNAYRCQPGDLGYYIQAKIISYDVVSNGSAEVTIGPIRLDSTVKQLIQGALYSKTLRSQVSLLEKTESRRIDVLLTDRQIKFTDELSNKRLDMDYDISEPKIQINPKDPTKVFLRFEQDTQNRVRQWIDAVCDQGNSFDVQSKKSFKSHGSGSSSSKVFRQANFVNKMEVAFLTRNSRDQFIFSMKAFICKQNMKNTVIMDAIEKVSEMKTEVDTHKFFQYMSLKTEICRLAELAKQLQTDRNNKLNDLNQAQEAIAETTLTYLKIIENKSKELNLDINQSISQISLRRDQILNKRQFRQMHTENENLKIKIRELTQQLELKNFFAKKNNQSLMLNQTGNPFAKKNMADSHYGPSLGLEEQQQRMPQNVAELSKMYASILSENRKLKQEKKVILANNNISKDQDIESLLQSLHESEKQAKNKQELQQSRRSKPSQGIKLNESVAYKQQTQNSQMQRSQQIEDKKEKSYLVGQNQKSYVDQSKQQGSFYSVAHSQMNESMTSEAGMLLLQKKIRQIDEVNKKIISQNDRLRKQRNQYRNLFEKQKKSGHSSGNVIEHRSVNSSFFDPEGLKQQNQNLTNERNNLLKKIQSLTRQLNKGQDNLLQKKCQELTKQNNYLRQQNESLKQKIQNSKNEVRSSNNFSENYQQNGKLKKINSQLLEQIKNLKLELERKANPIYNSRVIQLQNEVNYLKKSNSPGQGSDRATKDLLNQVSKLQKEVERLNVENSDKEAKLQSQASLIERLMSSQQSTHSISGKDKSYSQTRNDSESNEKLKKKIKQLQEQIVMMRRNADVFNRSHDMSKQMLSYTEDQIQTMRKQNEWLLQQNERLAKMCERYSKDARESGKQVLKWKQKALELMKIQEKEEL